jgi:hypothetical protein
MSDQGKFEASSFHRSSTPDSGETFDAVFKEFIDTSLFAFAQPTGPDFIEGSNASFPDRFFNGTTESALQVSGRPKSLSVLNDMLGPDTTWDAIAAPMEALLPQSLNRVSQDGLRQAEMYMNPVFIDQTATELTVLS